MSAAADNRILNNYVCPLIKGECYPLLIDIGINGALWFLNMWMFSQIYFYKIMKSTYFLSTYQ